MADSPKRKEPLKSVRRGQKSKSEELDARVDRLLNPQNYEDGVIPDWDTIGSLSEGEPLSVEDLISLRPFKLENFDELIAFRTPSKILRAVTRIKEKAGKIYDVQSDLFRDIFVMGLLIFSQRFEDIMGGEIVIERAMERVRRRKEIEDQVRRLAEALIQESEADRRADYIAFIENIRRQSIKVQDIYVRAMETSPLLVELRRRMVEIESREED